MRAYQVLRDYDDVPSLPTGYGGCFALAFIPPLWFAIMDKRVMKWAGKDINNVKSLSYIKKINPDIIILFGVGLLKQKFINLFSCELDKIGLFRT